MKKIVLGLIVAALGASILLGNVSHRSYGAMTVLAVVFVLGGLYAMVAGARERPGRQ